MDILITIIGNIISIASPFISLFIIWLIIKLIINAIPSRKNKGNVEEKDPYRTRNYTSTRTCPQCKNKVTGSKQRKLSSSKTTTETWTSSKKCGELKDPDGDKIVDIYRDIEHSRDIRYDSYTCWYEFTCKSCGHKWNSKAWLEDSTYTGFVESR